MTFEGFLQFSEREVFGYIQVLTCILVKFFEDVLVGLTEFQQNFVNGLTLAHLERGSVSRIMADNFLEDSQVEDMDTVYNILSKLSCWPFLKLIYFGQFLKILKDQKKGIL